MANRFLSNIRINDAYTLPASDGTTGQVIVTDGAGNLSFGDQSGGASSAAAIERDNFTGDGSTTVFYLQQSLSDEDQSQVYIDGVYQEKDTYDVTGNVLTFTTAPALGDSVEVISIYGINIGPTAIYQDNFTGDGTTVNFTLAQLVDNEIKTFVFLNGVYQFKGSYAINNTTLTFDAAPANGTAIEVITIASAAAEDYNQTLLFYGKASEAFSKGDAIMFAGQQGDHFLFAKATQAAIASNHEYFIGLASQDLSIGEFGYVTEFGRIDQIDTTVWTAGDILWFDAGGSTAGALTTTEPAAPLAKIQVATVIREHQNQGVLFVRPTWYHELGELHDVNITSVADKDMLVWDNANGYWENSKTLGDITATSLGVGVTPTEATVEIYKNANQGNPSNHTPANATLKIQDSSNQMYLDGNSIIQTGAASLAIGNTQAYSILFYTSASEKMRVDSSGSVGIGTSAPSAKLEIAKTSDATIRLNYGSITSNDAEDYYGGIEFYADGSSFGRPTVSSYIRAIHTRAGTAHTNSDSGLIFGTSTATNNTAATERMRIEAVTGNVGIGTNSPTRQLEVSKAGTAYIRAADTTNSVNVDMLAASSGGWIGTQSSHPFLLQTANTERMRITSTGSVGIGTSAPAYTLDVNGTAAFRSTTYMYDSTLYAYNSNSGTYMGFFADNAGDGYIATTTNNPIVFKTNNIDRGRFTNAGYFKAKAGGSYWSSTGVYHELIQNSSGNWTAIFNHSATSAPYGIYIPYSGTAPNGTGSEYLYFTDNIGLRFSVRSNGGVVNYQSNNVNLSDERVKTDVAPLGSYWDKFKALELVTFKYKDQTHDDTNIGLIAQQVESVAPEFVSNEGFSDEDKESDDPLKTIYTADLYHATIKVLQEAMAKIETLEAEIETLKSQINA